MERYIPQIFNDPTFIPQDVRSVLDVGCGKGIIGAMLRNYRSVNRLVGIDAFEPCITHAKRHYDEVLCIDIAGQKLPFDNDSFDLVLCLSTIEHFKHSEALFLLKEMVRIGQRVLVTTPTYFMPQGVLDENPYQMHLCQVTKQEFESSDYTVWGTGRIRIPKLEWTIPIESWVLGSLFPRWHSSFLAVAQRKGSVRP